jgi:hypothetical protein
VRTELTKVMAKNKLLTDVRCFVESVKIPRSGKDRKEQIDLVIQLGATLIVAEVKCYLRPADSVERSQYIEKLTGAVNQATRKAALLDRRRDLLSWTGRSAGRSPLRMRST